MKKCVEFNIIKVDTKEKGEIMGRIVKEIIKKYKWLFVIQIMLVIINMYVLVILPKVLGNTIDLLNDAANNRTQIITFLWVLVGVSFLLLFIRIVSGYSYVNLNRSIEKFMKDKLFSHVLKLKLEKLQNIKNGELMSYFVKDIGEIRRAIYESSNYGLKIIFISIFATYAMIKNVDLRLTVFTMIPIVVTAFIVVKIRKYIEKSFKKVQKDYTELSEYIQESTDGIRTIKAYAREEKQLKEFIRKNRKLKGSNNTVDVCSTLLNTCISICFGLCYGISILYGSSLVIAGDITIRRVYRI